MEVFVAPGGDRGLRREGDSPAVRRPAGAEGQESLAQRQLRESSAVDVEPPDVARRPVPSVISASRAEGDPATVRGVSRRLVVPIAIGQLSGGPAGDVDLEEMTAALVDPALAVEPAELLGDVADRRG